MSEIYLIGTVHIDIDGPSRLEKVLNSIKPGIVGVEMDQRRVDDLKLGSASLLKNIFFEQLHLILPQVSPALQATLRDYSSRLADARFYEYLASEKYCNNHRKKLELIDLPYPGTLKEFYDTLAEIEGDTSFTDKQIAALEKKVRDGPNEFMQNNRELIQVFYDKAIMTEDLYSYNPAHPSIQTVIQRMQTHHEVFGLNEQQNKVMKFVISAERNEYMAQRIREISQGAPDKTSLFIMGCDHLLPVRVLIKDLKPKVFALSDPGL